MEEILQGIQEEKIKSDTIYRLVEQMNRELVINYQKEFKKLFTVLLDRTHYPVVIHCTSGKGVQGSFPPYCLPLLESTKTSLWKTIV